MNQFIHAKELALYAQDALESETPWDKWQTMGKGDGHRWVDAIGPLHFNWYTQYRRKTPTLTIRGVEFEWEPVSFEEWSSGTPCYVPYMGVCGEGYMLCEYHCTDPRYVETRARQGLLCRTREQAIAFANAITKGYFKNV